jgi:hypothetical protein
LGGQVVDSLASEASPHYFFSDIDSQVMP